MKVARIIKISDKFTAHVFHLDQLNYKNNRIAISGDVKHQPFLFRNKSKSNRIDGSSHYYDKTGDTRSF